MPSECPLAALSPSLVLDFTLLRETVDGDAPVDEVKIYKKYVFEIKCFKRSVSFA